MLRTRFGTASTVRALSSAAHRPAEELWLPFTPNRWFNKQDEPRVAVRGHGMYFYDARNRPILDASAGLWCSAGGISPKPVVQAVQKQLETMTYAPAFMVSHEPAQKWAEAIVAEGKLAERGLNKVFFTMCGSTSVDTAVKMALAYHRSRGQGQRTMFIGREKAYHGVGLAGISVGGIGNNRAAFASALMPRVDHMRSTLNMQEQAFTRGQPETGANLADELEDLVALHGPQNVAAVIMEPVAGSAGVFVPPKGYLERVKAICEKHGILFILDEVITGFGRLGKPFAVDYFDINADIITTAKGLTGAVVPAGAVIASEAVYDSIVSAAPDEAIEFFHGYTYSCHPVSAAAGIAMIQYYHEAGLYDNARAMAPVLEDALHGSFDASNPYVVDVRNIGLMGAIQMRTPPGYGPGALGHAVMGHAWHNEDLYVRFTGDTLAFSPAFLVSEEEIGLIMERVKRSIDAVAPKFYAKSQGSA